MSEIKPAQLVFQTPSERGVFDSQIHPTKTQTETFQRADGSMDVDAGYKEVVRRGQGFDNFECSRKRFVDLCNETGEITPKSMQEAITALQMEAEGKVSNVRRDPIAQSNNIQATDFQREW